MIASYSWANGRANLPVIKDDVLALRKTFGRMDRGLGEPKVRVAADLWALMIDSREIKDSWDHKLYMMAHTKFMFDYSGFMITKDDALPSGTAHVTFTLAGVERWDTIEDCI